MKNRRHDGAHGAYHEFRQLRAKIDRLPTAAIRAAAPELRERWQLACAQIDAAAGGQLGFAWLIPLARVLMYAVGAGAALYVAASAKQVVDSGAAGAAEAAKWVPWVGTAGLAWWLYNVGKRPRRRKSTKRKAVAA